MRLENCGHGVLRGEAVARGDDEVGLERAERAHPLDLAPLPRHEVQVGQVQDPERRTARGEHRQREAPQRERAGLTTSRSQARRHRRRGRRGARSVARSTVSRALPGTAKSAQAGGESSRDLSSARCEDGGMSDISTGLKARLQSDLTEAMRSRDELHRRHAADGAHRRPCGGGRGQHGAEAVRRGGRRPSSAREVKKRREAAAAFDDAGRARIRPPGSAASSPSSRPTCRSSCRTTTLQAVVAEEVAAAAASRGRAGWPRWAVS